MKRILARWPLWLSPLMAAAFFVVLSRITYFRHENSDDFLMVRAFLGFEGQPVSSPHLYLHPLLIRALNAAGAVMPQVAWFSVMQFALLWLSASVLCYCMLTCGRLARLHPAAAIASAALFLGVFASFVCTRLNYTTTTAMLGAAAAALLACACAGGLSPGAAALLSGALVMLGGMLRDTSLPALLGFWLLMLAFLCLRVARGGAAQRRSLLRGLIPVLAVGAALVGVRLWETHTYSGYFDFHQARVELMDYHFEALENVAPEVLEALGWDASEAELVRQWYFMDENITADALRLIQSSGSTQRSLGERAAAVPGALLSFFRENPSYALSLAVVIALTALACMAPRERRRQALCLALASCALFAAMLLYLGWQGRLLGRGVDCALLPAAAVAACLAISAFPAWKGRGTRVAAACLCAVLVVTAAFSLRQTHATLTRRPDAVSPAREADLEAFALEHPDRLIVRTPDLLRDTRLFPDVSAGVPTNTMIWGDWMCRTPGWNAQLARFGFDPEGFTATDFLGGTILFATDGDAPPEALLAYIEHEAERPVSCTLEGERGDLRFFSFH